MGWQELACSLLTCGILLGSPVISAKVSSRTCFRPVNSDTTVYNFTVPDLMETRNISLSEYRDKVLLIVNVATY
ncbi:hypothetical protein X975_18729, partial [Stegodyphus mimosarum]